MSTISHDTYEILINKIAYWLINNKKSFTKRALYEYQGRTADQATVENAILQRGQNGQIGDGLTGRYTEAAIVDNSNKDFLPNYVTYNNTKYMKANYIDMVIRVLQYEQKHGTIPLTVNTDVSPSPTPTPTPTCTNPYTSTPHPTKTGCNAMGQNNSVCCGPSAIQKALYKFGIRDITQGTLSSWAGTTSAGSSHSGLETAIAMVNKTKGINISIRWYNKSDLSWDEIGKIICQPNKAIFCHILYKNGGTCNGSGNYGHYELLTKVNTATGYVKVLNSLGSKCSQGCYCGFYQDRTIACQEQFMRGISQKSIAVLTMTR